MDQGFLGYNMFAYCRSSPISRIDIEGFKDKYLDVTYATPEETESTFIAWFCCATLEFGVEVFVYIVEFTVDGEIRYDFKFVSYGQRAYDSSEVKYVVSPKFSYSKLDGGYYGTYKIVGEVHTHRSSPYFSIIDDMNVKKNLDCAEKMV